MIAIVANPNALKFNTYQLKNIVSILEADGYGVDVFFTKKARCGTAIANKIASKYRIIAVYGGDGIINEVINADLKDSVLGILPAGTTNVLALELGISLNPIAAARLLINNNTKTIYAGLVNNKRFALMAGFGFDALAVKNVNPFIKKISGKAAYFLSGVLTYLSLNSDLIRITVENKTYDARWVIVSKAKKYAGNFSISRTVDVAKPFFDVLIFNKIITGAIDLPIDNLLLFSGLSERFKALSKHVITDKPILIDYAPIQVDGDFLETNKSEVKLSSKPIKVIVP